MRSARRGGAGRARAGARKGHALRRFDDLSNGIVWSFARAEEVRARLPEGDAALQDLVVEQLPAGLEWLASHGVALQPKEQYFGYGHGCPASGPQMTEALCQAIRARGGSLLTGAGVQRLLSEDGAVRGALAFGADGPVEARARAVILATGGFQGNAELLARHVSPHAAAMYLRANPWSTGDGLLAALEAGAATTPELGSFYGHAMTAPPARFGAERFQEMSHKYGPIAVAINLDGRRFADESAGTGEETLNIALARQRRATAAYIFDAATANRAYEAGPLASVIVERARPGGRPGDGVGYAGGTGRANAGGGASRRGKCCRPLREFNASLARRRTRAAGSRRATTSRMPWCKPPFTAALVRAAITFTCGGLSVDLDMRVLRRAASVSMLPLLKAPAEDLLVAPVPQLYAAGCDVGGVSGESYMGGLAQALVTGRVAGAQASR